MLGPCSVVTCVQARLIAVGFWVFSTYINTVWQILIADPMLDLDIQELASLTTGGGDLENFERLFSKLKEMKGNWIRWVLQVSVVMLLCLI